ncbi:glycosyltransferase [Pseudorhodobacter sp. E13]|uniref:glycosyltransferase family 2 protein n=1 Tax=Pseudorhodobacter sp. E13 TaxID=2487931 RepID=UPI000F8E8764|nr:glycosyltransferase family 2 protein [Pseudorhodobacter sp. E13]RUS58507.1 glycosyltransferase [Pseudorhodobacter sp. E13]
MTASTPFLSPDLLQPADAAVDKGASVATSPKPNGGKRYSVTAPSVRSLGVTLLREGALSAHDLVTALSLQKRHRGRLSDILLSRQMVAEETLYKAQARHWNVRLLDPMDQPADPRLIDDIGAATCLRDGLIPWQRVGKAVVVATAHPEEFASHYPRLRAAFGTVIMAIAPASKIEAAVLRARSAALNHAAENRVAEAESCRDWGRDGLAVKVALILGVFGLGLWLSPAFMALAFTFWATLTLALSTALRAGAVFAALRNTAPPPPDPIIARLPTVSIMVALFKEGNIAPRLIRRLSRLDYPRDLLDILLVVEEKDHLTRDALKSADLPPWMRVVVVPDGPLKTKPRALNFGLDLCRGSIIGVYDAEDAPEPDQIHKVVNRFYQRGADVACLQGVLDFYNPRTNWLSRCFTMEYAAWFRVILPGLQKLGMAIPLGGTTLFFRRAALEELGGWDAHNVTEDADLGMRLARYGYSAEIIDTVTEEEANCRALPWVRQRSRWLKGYMMTWAVHMRDPMLLWRQLGPRKFIGFQILFLCTLSQFLLAPVLWSFWLVPLGVPHPLATALPPVVMLGLMGLYLLTEVINITLNVIGLRKTNHKLNPLWVGTLHFYFPLGALASYKAAWEMVSKPFYWDKTSHGHFDPSEADH